MTNVKGKKISIIMPAYNEEDRIAHGLDETVRTLDTFECDYQIIVVDDGSADRTTERIKEFIDKNDSGRLIFKRNRSNYGKGRALKQGFRHAKGDYVIFLDSDMDLHPGQISTFFDIMELTESDVVIGSKRHPNSQLFYPKERRIMSAVYFFMIKLLFGLPINDTQTGLKLFKSYVLKDVFKMFISREFAFDLELLVNAHLLGYKIEEAPVVLNSQREYSRIGYKTVVKMCLDTLAIYMRYVRSRAKRRLKKIVRRRKIT